jgi:hypothetical protein
MYEHRAMPLAPLPVFRRRLIGAGTLGVGLIAASLIVGIAGYMLTEHLAFIDAFLNAAMILSGMGPLHSPESVAGKLFAGLYAIYCGFAVLGIAAVMFAPVVHRLFHRFHIEAEEHAVREKHHASQ